MRISCFAFRGFWILGFLCFVFVESCAVFVRAPEFEESIAKLEVGDVSEIERRVVELREEIKYHDNLYFRLAAPEISDEAYDVLKRELRDLENSLVEGSSVGHSVSGFGDDRLAGTGKGSHFAAMLSLEKAYSKSEVEAFYSSLSVALEVDSPVVLAEPKVDGIAVSLLYEKGSLVSATTRGNGYEGNDITEVIRVLEGVPRNLNQDDSEISVPDRIEFRGELFFSFDAFYRINVQRESEGKKPFVHPRNLAAGTVRLKDRDEIVFRGLSLVVFGYGVYEPAFDEPNRLLEFYKRANAWGLPVVDQISVCSNFEDLKGAIDAFEINRGVYPFPTDGLVIKTDSLFLRQELGVTSYAPNWAIAYKYSGVEKETVVEQILIKVGRTGRLTPVAVLQPVEISGSLITRVSLHNFDTLNRLDIRVGDVVRIKKAGQVIPKLESVNLLKRSSDCIRFVLPEKCPSCGSELNLEGEAQLSCENRKCPERVKRELAYFASREVVGIRGLGKKKVESLYEKGCLSNFADIYRLKNSERLSEGSNLSETDRALLASIEATKHKALWRFVCGFGIPGVGKKRAQVLAKQMKYLNALPHITMDDFDEIEASQGSRFNQANRYIIVEFLSRSSFVSLIKELTDLGVAPSCD